MLDMATFKEFFLVYRDQDTISTYYIALPFTVFLLVTSKKRTVTVSY